jgi:hypothetical protein
VEQFPDHRRIHVDERDKMYPTTGAHLKVASGHLQNRLTLLELSIHRYELVQRMDVSQQAALLSASSKGSSAFLQAIPSSANLFIPSRKLEVAIRDRLCLSPFNDEIPNCCHPGCTARRIDHEDADDTARDLRRDPHSTGACARHAAVIKQLTLCFRAVNIPTTLEPIIQENPLRRGDIAEQVTSRDGRTTVYDITVVDPTARHIRERAAKEAGAAAKHAHQLKNNKYLEKARRLGLRFFPLVLESSGHMDKSFLDLLEILERRAQLIPDAVPEFTTWAAPNFRQYWLQRISIALQCGTANMSLRSFERRQRAIWNREEALGLRI